MSRHPSPWWRKTTVYQIYPRSFCDSNGDGIGDLEGIISRLDHVKDLGIETIWFSPFYKSPQADFGYDISDYRDIAPEYGTMATCDRLIKEVHDREMRVVLDMVLNHTSDQHAWFLESRKDKENPKRDWYVWRDGKKPGGKAPPNNWNSMVTGSGWHHDLATDQWYWAQFLPCQPDLNYRNPAVRAEMLDTMRFWLRKGVDGFRLDIINAIFEDEQFRDNPRSWRVLPSETSTDMLFQKPVHTLNHPDTLEFMKDLRATVDEFNDPPRFMVGEVSAPLDLLVRYHGERDDGLHLTFQFQALGMPLQAAKVRHVVASFERHFPPPLLPTWVFSNHDRFRRASRLGGNVEKAKLNVALQMTARGVPFVYYGEEVGMEQHRIPVKRALDPVALRLAWAPQVLHDLVRKVMKESVNRDECRTPMQWTPGENAGFSKPGVAPWLPVTPSFTSRNVESQLADPASLLHCYKRFLAARKATPALNDGSLAIISMPGQPASVLCYDRDTGDGRPARALLHFGAGTVTVRHGASGPVEVLASTAVEPPRIEGDVVVLRPWEGIVVITHA